MPTFGSLFAGIGGIDLGLERAGWKVICTSSRRGILSAGENQHFRGVAFFGRGEWGTWGTFHGSRPSKVINARLFGAEGVKVPQLPQVPPHRPSVRLTTVHVWVRWALHHSLEALALQLVQHGTIVFDGTELNHRWVAQLMGFPSDWLEGIDVPPSKPSATASSRKSSKPSDEQSEV